MNIPIGIHTNISKNSKPPSEKRAQKKEVYGLPLPVRHNKTPSIEGVVFNERAMNGRVLSRRLDSKESLKKGVKACEVPDAKNTEFSQEAEKEP